MCLVLYTVNITFLCNGGKYRHRRAKEVWSIYYMFQLCAVAQVKMHTHRLLSCSMAMGLIRLVVALPHLPPKSQIGTISLKGRARTGQQTKHRSRLTGEGCLITHRSRALDCRRSDDHRILNIYYTKEMLERGEPTADK